MEPTYNQSSDIFPAQLPVTYAGFWRRFLAALLDGIIINVPLSIVSYALGEYDRAPTSILDAYISVSNGLALAVTWLYYALQESSAAQATLGKRALGIKVTGTEGERISFGHATGRHFGKIISSIILLIGYLMMLWDDRRQTLHDKLANTLVVHQ